MKNNIKSLFMLMTFLLAFSTNGKTQASSLPCESRTPIDSVFNGTRYEITEPGSYYLTHNITVNTANVDGVIIDADNVTLDLNGYTLDGSEVGRDGVRVQGEQDNIVVKNGIVENWASDGVDALYADQSSFMNIKARNNDGDGIVADFNCLIDRCIAEGNGLDGLEVDDGGIISNSTANNNGDNGIQTSEGAMVFNCTSFGNVTDGIDTGSGSRVENCSVYENDIYGIDLGLGGQVINCAANYNGRNGMDISSSCLVMNNTANNNGHCWLDDDCSFNGVKGAGIRTFANAQLINNTCNDNIMGIIIQSTDSYMGDNHCEGNRHAGILVEASGNLIIRNYGYNNGYNPVQELVDNGYLTGNIVLHANSAYGPIIDVSSATDIINTSGADHPYTNFEY